MNERMKIRNEKEAYKYPAYIRHAVIHDGHDSKVNERCYEIKRSIKH